MFNFDEWFERFWQTYPNDLLHSTKGAKTGPWARKLRNFVRSQETANKVLGGLRAQVEHSRELKNKGENKTTWHFPLVATWCNQERWSIEIPGKQAVAKPQINPGAYKANLPKDVVVNKTLAREAMIKARQALRGGK